MNNGSGSLFGRYAYLTKTICRGVIGRLDLQCDIREHNDIRHNWSMYTVH